MAGVPLAGRVRTLLAGPLRFRLFLLVGLAVLPALGYVAYAAQRHRRAMAEEVKSSAMRLAEHLALQQEQIVEGVREVLTLLAGLPEVRARHAAACSERLGELVAGFRRYANLGVIARDGTLLCSGVPTPGPENLADRLYFRRALETRALAVGEYQVGRITGRRSVNFGYPVLDASGRVGAVAFAALDLDWLSERLSAASLGPGAAVALLDTHGRVLARNPDPGLWVGRVPDVPVVLEAVLAGRDTLVAEAPGLDGVRRLLGMRRLRVAGGDLYVLVGVPAAQAYAAVDRMLAPQLGALALFGLLAALMTALGSQVLVLRPVHVLAAATRRLAAGDLSARTGVGDGGGEMGQLARAFDEMAARLEERTGELAEVTQALRALIDASPLAVVELDREARVRTWNPAAEDLFGWRASEIGRASCRERV